MGTFVAKKLGEKLLEKIAKCNNVFKHSMGRFTRYDIHRVNRPEEVLPTTSRVQHYERQINDDDDDDDDEGDGDDDDNDDDDAVLLMIIIIGEKDDDD